ncbi:DUF3219 family protein [Litchfieldia alkalitelluris]|uniref:DUF3219 family protein n=1 Tax=Litchfieldia alkalitelluris TaxID=304268 RepID=UPI00099753AE|nr:DUF3219 family protein [Litchfieldia alkalitelluris]
MVKQIRLDEEKINVNNFRSEEMYDKKSGKKIKKVIADFKVSNEDYHRVTTLLYRMTFTVRVLERELEFKGTISNYSTSFTNLYKEGAVGDFHLELIEVID